jgi:hypothetical protein
MIQAEGLAKNQAEYPRKSPFAGIMAGKGPGIMAPTDSPMRHKVLSRTLTPTLGGISITLERGQRVNPA